ncbi:peptidoglycan-binding domain-containing protein [Yinghuangia seranimata]|uniref:peptidoglycan-binding domain-containing protein n=1 Tax=Yinghuangia seranimata TaxID=408067 RepID=UPI00248AE45E|nr:peptidoglycan-binding domain-containing protein [Yinghuangia seranimata]MDI2124881.1 peptidoglycan-binding domain-containing protein [Yinghuangia seranimata]
MRTRTVRTVSVAGVAAVVALGVTGTVVFGPDHDGKASSQSKQQPSGATVPIVQGDLTVSDDVDGTLGFGGTGTVYAQAKDPGGTGGGAGAPGGNGAGAGSGSGGAGNPAPGGSPSQPPGGGKDNANKDNKQDSGNRIYTGLPKVGDIVKQGEAIYQVNGRSVPLFYGDAPLWRALSKGVADGPDVRLVKRNLVALGFGKGLSIDDKFTDGTTEAVKRWQKSLGAPQTGTVDPSDIAVQPGAVRVTALKASVGAPAQGEVATVSGTGRQVSVPLPVDKQKLAHKGDKVTVKLPDGRTTPGTVTDIGTVATKEENNGGGMPGQGGGKSVIQVTVALDKPDDAGALDGAPVSVGFVGDSRKHVLSVPVNALVALAEGGYGVEVVDDLGGKRLVGVKPGLFANGRVEVTGDGLAAGQKVRVPA